MVSAFQRISYYFKTIADTTGKMRKGSHNMELQLTKHAFTSWEILFFFRLITRIHGYFSWTVGYLLLLVKRILSERYRQHQKQFRHNMKSRTTYGKSIIMTRRYANTMTKMQKGHIGLKLTRHKSTCWKIIFFFWHRTRNFWPFFLVGNLLGRYFQ